MKGKSQKNLRVVGVVLFWSLVVFFLLMWMIVGFDRGVALSPQEEIATMNANIGIFLLVGGFLALIAFALSFYYFMKHDD